MEAARGDATGGGPGAPARWLGPPGSELRRWPAGLFLLHRAVHGFFVLQRFAFFFLAVLVPALATGLQVALRALLRGGRARRVGVPAGLALAPTGYAALAAPQLLRVETRAELDALAARSLAEGRPLYVVFSYAALNARRIAALFEPVLDPRFFEPQARFDGIEGELVIRVRRYTGVPLDESRGG